jgi:hypothetical protein
MHTMLGHTYGAQRHVERCGAGTLRQFHTVGMLLVLTLGFLLAPLAVAQPVALPRRIGVLGPWLLKAPINCSKADIEQVHTAKKSLTCRCLRCRRTKDTAGEGRGWPWAVLHA